MHPLSHHQELRPNTGFIIDDAFKKAKNSEIQNKLQTTLHNLGKINNTLADYKDQLASSSVTVKSGKALLTQGNHTKNLDTTAAHILKLLDESPSLFFMPKQEGTRVFVTAPLEEHSLFETRGEVPIDLEKCNLESIELVNQLVQDNIPRLKKEVLSNLKTAYLANDKKMGFWDKVLSWFSSLFGEKDDTREKVFKKKL